MAVLIALNLTNKNNILLFMLNKISSVHLFKYKLQAQHYSYHQIMCKIMEAIEYIIVRLKSAILCTNQAINLQVFLLISWILLELFQ